MRNTLTAFMPAHKQTNPEHKPGQVVFFPEPSSNTVTNPLGFTIQPSEQTLAEYINRVKRDDAFDQIATEKKLTFDQWAVSQGYGYFYASGKMQWSAGTRLSETEVRNIWKAAQENK